MLGSPSPQNSQTTANDTVLSEAQSNGMGVRSEQRAAKRSLQRGRRHGRFSRTAAKQELILRPRCEALSGKIKGKIAIDPPRTVCSLGKKGRRGNALPLPREQGKVRAKRLLSQNGYLALDTSHLQPQQHVTTSWIDAMMQQVRTLFTSSLHLCPLHICTSAPHTPDPTTREPPAWTPLHFLYFRDLSWDCGGLCAFFTIENVPTMHIWALWTSCETPTAIFSVIFFFFSIFGPSPCASPNPICFSCLSSNILFRTPPKQIKSLRPKSVWAQI